RSAARLARARRHDDARDDGFGRTDVRVEPVLEARPDDAIDNARDFGIVETILRLPLKLRLLHEDADDADDALADVVGRDRHALRREVVRLDEVADGLAEPGAEAVLVGAARSRRNAVDVTAQMLVGRQRPLEGEIDAQPALVVLTGERERDLLDRLAAAVGEDLLQVVGKAFLVLKDLALRLSLLGGLVLERDLHAAMQVAGDLEAVADDDRVELDPRKNRGVGTEEHRGARAARGAELLHGSKGHALFELLLPLGAIAAYRRDQFLRQRIDDRRTDSVKAARRLVVAVLELAAGMQRREDDFERALLRLRMLVDRNTAAIVGDRQRRFVLVQGDRDVRRMAVHRLVDRVVENFPDEVMESGDANATDVHAGPLADRLEALENRNVFGCVAGCHGEDDSTTVCSPDRSGSEFCEQHNLTGVIGQMLHLAVQQHVSGDALARSPVTRIVDGLEQIRSE